MEKLFIDNFETFYMINQQGQIFNTKTKRFQKLAENGTVQLRVNGKNKTCSISHLVATTYIENPNNYKLTKHIDGDRTNNCVENIKWISNKENAENSSLMRKKNGSFKIVGKEVQNIVEKRYTSPEDMVEENTVYCCRANNGLTVRSDGQIFNGSEKIPITVRTDGYYSFRFQSKKYLVHVFIWESFNRRKKKQGMDINHINGNKADNRLCNLEEISHRQNMLHAAEKLGRCGAKPVGEYGENGELLRRFGSAGEAARAIRILPGSMRNTIRRQGKCHNGLQYKYLV